MLETFGSFINWIRLLPFLSFVRVWASLSVHYRNIHHLTIPKIPHILKTYKHCAQLCQKCISRSKHRWKPDIHLSSPSVSMPPPPTVFDRGVKLPLVHKATILIPTLLLEGATTIVILPHLWNSGTALQMLRKENHPKRPRMLLKNIAISPCPPAP